MFREKTVLKPVSDRTWIGKFAKYIFILANIIMLLMAAGSLRSLDRPLGFLSLFFLLIPWMLINVVLGTFVLATRRIRLVRTEDYLTFKRQEKAYRTEESIRNWSMTLAIWVIGTALAGAWLPSLIGLFFGIAIAVTAYVGAPRLWANRPSRRTQFTAESTQRPAVSGPLRKEFGRRKSPQD